MFQRKLLMSMGAGRFIHQAAVPRKNDIEKRGRVLLRSKYGTQELTGSEFSWSSLELRRKNQGEGEAFSNGSLFRNLEKKPFRVAFDLGYVKTPWSSGCVAGELDGVVPLGSVPRQDFSSVLAMQDRVTQWGIDVGLFKLSSPYYHKQFQLNAPSWSICTVPGVNMDHLELYTLLFSLVFVLDDVFDNAIDFAHEKKHSDKNLFELSQICKALDDCHKGKCPSDVPHLHSFPMFFPLAKACWDIGTNVKSKWGAEATVWFEQAFSDYVQFVAWEERVDTNSILAQNFTKAFTGGAIVPLELNLLTRGIRIPQEIRNEPLFRLLSYLCAIHVTMVNDIMSLKKEVFMNEKSNVLLKRCRRMSLQESVEQITTELNDTVEAIRRNRVALLKLYAGTEHEESLTGFCDALLYFLIGHIQWYTTNERYGDISFDCVILN